MDIESRIDLFFCDTFAVDDLKNFIIQDNKKVAEKIHFGAEQLTRMDKKITLLNIKFKLNACKNLPQKNLDDLSNTARDFFDFIQSFGNNLKLRHFVNACILEDGNQDLDSVTFGIFKIYFYSNLNKTAKYKTKQN